MIHSSLRDLWVIAIAAGLLVYGLFTFWEAQLDTSRLTYEKDIRHLTSQNRRFKERGLNRTQPASEIYLSAILYVDEDHWTVWVNDHPLHQEDFPSLEGYEFVSITKEGLTLNHRGNLIEMHAHQTYWPQEHRVLNGDERRNEKPADSPNTADPHLPFDIQEDRLHSPA